MSEEQNLFDAVAVAAPPRAKTRAKRAVPEQNVSSSEARGDGGGESGSSDGGGAMSSGGALNGGGESGGAGEMSGAGEPGSVADGQGGSASSKSRRRRRKRKNRSAQAGQGSGVQGGSSQAGGSQGSGPQDGQAVGSIEAAAGDAATDGPREVRQVSGQAGSGHAVIGQGFQSGGSQNNGGGQHNGGGQNSQGQHAGGAGSSRRKKKKFRRAGEGGESGGGAGQNGFQGGFQGGGQNGYVRPPRPEPGNSLHGSTSGMGQRRNRKQQGGGGQSRGPRQFVGPMDHSYREVNGNFADVPASTIQTSQTRHRNAGHRHFNEDRMPPELLHNNRPVAIPEDAPTHIYFFIEDLFFTAKIQEVAKQQGVKVAFMKPDKDVVAHLSELHDHEHPSLIVFDLNNAAAKPLTLIPKLKAKLKKGTSILGFLSHLQGDLKQKAVEAGCHTVMPRSAFSQNLPNLLRRYGVEDEHEPNFNQ